ncbi:AlpA family transcriptional regulator [Massilia sp. Root351]|uniref:helix-turn-helix transcriptional regulator n=1 Tax=Massilia sp. Root351 TaxID=1736522 RepID=UPI0009E78EA8|nr:AlpA family phage regulatory protein [Massilia sp. Root351]
MSKTEEINANVRLLRLPSVVAQVGLKKTAIYDGVKRGTFPAPLKLGERAVAWKATDIEAWVSTLVRAEAKVSMRKSNDSIRLTWALPILTGIDDATTNKRTAALSKALAQGLDGIEAIDVAIVATTPEMLNQPEVQVSQQESSE